MGSCPLYVGVATLDLFSYSFIVSFIWGEDKTSILHRSKLKLAQWGSSRRFPRTLQRQKSIFGFWRFEKAFFLNSQYMFYNPYPTLGSLFFALFFSPFLRGQPKAARRAAYLPTCLPACQATTQDTSTRQSISRSRGPAAFW